MPKQVGQRVRRRQIVDAVWSVIADRGLEAVSLRHVAAAAGVSVAVATLDDELHRLLDSSAFTVDGDVRVAGREALAAAVPLGGGQRR